MKKRIMTFLLAVTLVFGAASESMRADELPAEGSSASDEIVTETDLSSKTGFLQPVPAELAEDELPEVYEPSLDTAEYKRSAVYKNAWDAYSTNYYYNQLNDSQRALWDKLDQMCFEILTGTETFTNRQHYQNAKSQLDVYYYPTKMVTYANMSREEAYELEFKFITSNPQYYFLETMLFDTTGSNTGGFAYLTINESFANGAARQAATQQVQSVINSWLPQINAQPTELLKEKKIHDLICEKVTYDWNYKTYNRNKYNQTVYSVFCTDTTVCAGYSQAMQLLCNAVGIDCGIVTSEEHEWNIIRLNGIWYYVDLTWNDIDPKDYEIVGLSIIYNYFNKSAAAFMNDSPGNVTSHTVEDRWNGYLPELTYDSGATQSDPGTIHTPTATLSTPVISCPGSVVTITAPAGASVYYTTDGSNPSIAFTKSKKYTAPFSLSGTTTVRAVAVQNGVYDSAVTGITITPKYNIVFNANGGYIGSKSTKTTSKTGLAYGTAVGKLSGPRRKNYAFLGWYTKKSGGKKISENTPVTVDAVYYAHWGKINTKKKTSVASVKNNAAKTMKIKIKSVSIASGYQVRYSSSKNMSSAKKKEVTENTCTINKLKKGKTYYVQVRIYQKESVSGKKKYGAWSKTKSVKIKK